VFCGRHKQREYLSSTQQIYTPRTQEKKGARGYDFDPERRWKPVYHFYRAEVEKDFGTLLLPAKGTPIASWFWAWITYAAES
jgi:hypothetical protein